MKNLVPQSLKNVYHLFQAIFANVWYGFPSRRLKVIGVTGTNGKTTTVQMIAKILEEAGYKIAVASTINFKIGEKEWVNKSKFTTLSSWALQKFLRRAVAAGCEYAVLEVSSHSLDQNRVWGVDFDVAVIANITREHLDYHETMEEYAKVKGKLFAMAAKNSNGVAVINLEMDNAENFLKYTIKERYGYGIKVQSPKSKVQSDSLKLKIIEAENIQLNIQNTKYQILNTNFQLNLPGEFNVENALAATCVGLSQNIPLEKIAEALGKIKNIPGRMERIGNDKGLEIIVDYAVTPDSLEKLYSLVGEMRKRGEIRDGRIIAVFGACGERDRGKRPIMGEIVARVADYVIITNEDPYGEDPQQIIDEVFEGVKKHKEENENAFRILDRREAIKKALEMARAGDIVVITGKGAEETMAVGKERIPWNDPAVIRETLREQVSPKNR
ncbi:MAG: UDP-N-acetylmuramoyl-L-alanyl-D-glutamate--2,6-diaminopimelate ligase [Patescibacteria group bacterium]|nr:UDP-N-acetylmuramoyl-L-alanyl-D-glutamate--2,6-diaminopimelate ligase [Patescibacteria group bacterium]